jgi:thiol-disulfide isomerase/thioredoxin
MALTTGTGIALGTPCPEFNLPSLEGKNYGSENFKDRRVLVVMFICNHCPYVKAVEDRIIELQRRYAGKSVQLVGICSNDPTDYPEDSFENLRRRWHERNYGFPYLHDVEQTAARAFGAVCTPEFFVYGQDRKLAYHGRMDDNWQNPNEVIHQDLREAIDALLAYRQPDENQSPSMGCSIKWIMPE